MIHFYPMTYSHNKLPKSLVEIKAEVPWEEFELYHGQAVADLAKEIRLEGFRPGHVPPRVAEKYISEEKVLVEMAERSIRDVYIKAVQEHNLQIIGEPKVEILKLAKANPFEFRVEVSVLPEIELPSYQKIAEKVERKIVTVEDKEVEDTINWLRESRKTSDGAIPEVTDEFAMSLGDFQSMDELRASLKEGLQKEKETKEKERLREEILEKIAKEAKAEIPLALIEREKQSMLDRMRQGVSQTLRMQFDKYLEQAKKTEQELLYSFGEEAEKRVKKYLVLRDISEKEQVVVTPEEVEEEITRISSYYKSIGAAERDFDPERLKEYTEGLMRNEKTMDILEGFVKSNS